MLLYILKEAVTEVESSDAEADDTTLIVASVAPTWQIQTFSLLVSVHSSV
jgi:hypothetical protein